MSDFTHAGLFDSAAEALILLDPSDAATVVDLVGRFSAIRDLFGSPVDPTHPACVALSCAHQVSGGDVSVLAELEAAYAAARALAVRAEQVAEPPSMPLAGDEELLRDFGIRAVEHLDDADEQLLALETDPLNAEAIDAVFRAFHTIKGMAGFLALDDISEHAHSSESLLSDARAERAAVSDQAVQSLFSAVDRMRALVQDATGIGEVSLCAAPASATGMDVAAQRANPVGTAREGTVRVEEQRLDGLLDTIGEMVIAESMVSASLRSGLDEAAVALQLDRLDKITRELQQMATSLRMVSMRATFRRMSRLVRDLALKAGKDVEFVTYGDDIELDKEVVDRISDPLVHALRNAVDHGLETAEERVAAGKSAVGRIELRAHHAGGAIHIDVTDDGRGIDVDRVLERARERGLISAEETPDERTLLEIVFEPGFSTADQVTDVSGRGVGMDVVRRAIEELRGRVELSSTRGVGTTLSATLPITLAIIDGMVARVGDERYIIPVLSIERSVRPSEGQVTTVKGAGEMLVTDDGLVPIVRLDRAFSIPKAEQDPTKAVVVITHNNGSRTGLMACELLGQQQTVIKPLGEGLPERHGIAGGAIMPDGLVGLILDSAGLVRHARRGGNTT